MIDSWPVDRHKPKLEKTNFTQTNQNGRPTSTKFGWDRLDQAEAPKTRETLYLYVDFSWIVDGQLNIYDRVGR